MAHWLDALCPLPVAVARDGEPVLPGHIYLADPATHLTVAPGRILRLCPRAPGDIYRPSCDRLAVLGGRGRRPARDRCHPHRHGPGRGPGHRRHRRGRRDHHRPGRGQLRGLRHEPGGDPGRRRAAGAAARRHRRATVAGPVAARPERESGRPPRPCSGSGWACASRVTAEVQLRQAIDRADGGGWGWRTWRTIWRGCARMRWPLQALTSLLTIKETYFYREPEHLRLLTEHLAPALLRERAPGAAGADPVGGLRHRGGALLHRHRPARALGRAGRAAVPDQRRGCRPARAWRAPAPVAIGPSPSVPCRPT